MRNIVIIHCHDLGRHIGTYGVSSAKTPHIDAFAGTALTCESAYAVAPQCSPARASLFTSTYPQQNGVLGLTNDPFGWDLNHPERHLANVTKQAGYRTAMVGVHHESRVLADDAVALRLGFDEFSSGGDAETVVTRTLDVLSRFAGSPEPFYLQVGFHEPHRDPSPNDKLGVRGFLGKGVQAGPIDRVEVPTYLEDTIEARVELAELRDAVSVLDSAFGRVIAAIDAAGLRDDTIVVFTTDHGVALPRAKGSLYDPGLEVALIVRWPHMGAMAGSRLERLISHIDVVPTVLRAAELDVPTWAEGRDLAEILVDGPPSADKVFAQLTYHAYYDPKRSVRTPEFKLIANFSNAPQAMDATQSWVRRSTPRGLVDNAMASSAAIELYDLATDPDEMHNLADAPELSSIREQLLRDLLEWMVRVDDPLLRGPVPSPRHYETIRVLLGPRDADSADHPAATALHTTENVRTQ